MRFDQCTETCTTDCGHCKGRPVEALRADNDRLARRLAGRYEETEKLRAERDNALAEVARLQRELGRAQDEVGRVRTRLLDEAAFWKGQRDLAAQVAAKIADLDEESPALRQMLRTERGRREAEEARNISLEVERDALAAQLGVEEANAAQGWKCFNDQLDATRELDDLRMREIGELTRDHAALAARLERAEADMRVKIAAEIRAIDVQRIADLDGDTARVGLTVAARTAEGTYRAATPSTPEPTP